MTRSSSTESSPSPRRGWLGRVLEAVGVPLVGRRVFAVAALTLQAALRYRLVQVLAILLLAAVVGLPSVIRHDGTATGFTQILLTYTLGSITALLALATLWLGCGTLARDVEECQIQVVAVKPIARWEIWVGKWLGIVALNAGLLVVSGLVVFALMEWRARQLPQEVQQELRNKVLVARGAVREPVDYAGISKEAERQFQERLKDPSLAALDRGFVRTQILERVKAQYQIVPPRTGRTWALQLGSAAAALRDKPLSVRTKFYSAEGSASGTFYGFWEIGPRNGRRWRPEAMSLAPETFHEFVIPPGLIDEQGVLTIDFANLNDTALLFPLEDGLEVLYPQGQFGPSYVRGLAIVLCWMALLAAIGLAAGSFLSFPVAAMVAFGVLVLAGSTGTLKQVIEEGGIAHVNTNTGRVDVPGWIDRVAVPVFRGMLWTINLARDFSPVDSLSTGRNVTWGQLGRAVGQIVALMGGMFAAAGVYLFTRRELAAAQGT